MAGSRRDGHSDPAGAFLSAPRRAGALGAPPQLLSDFLSVADEPRRYRVEGLMPLGARVVFSAQAKAGKSTVMNNLVRCLVDGDPFLGQFHVDPVEGRVLLIDVELSESMLRSWLRDQAIRCQDSVAVLPLRGRVSEFDIMTVAGRRLWAHRLRELGVSFVVLDCLRPLLDALNLSEDKDAGRFFVAFDALLNEAGVGEGLVVHHMGHDGQRSRGDTRIRDWPDAEWCLSKGQAGCRQFWAVGRDVDLARTSLTFDMERRRVVAGSSPPPSTAGSAPTPERDWAHLLQDLLSESPGMSQRALEAAARQFGDRAQLREARKRLADRGVIVNRGSAASPRWHMAD